MRKGEDLPTQRTTADEVHHLGQLLTHCGKRMTGQELLRRGGRYRLVDRTLLMKEMLRLVEVFVDDRVRQAETQIASLVERREDEAREEGRMRVLVSLADLGDLVDSIVQSLASESDSAATKALDKRLDRIFRSYGFERTPTVGMPFNPVFHEAIDEQSSEDADSGIVLEELGRGYHQEDFVLRVARVIVAT